MICEVNTAFGMQFTLPVVTLAQGVGMVDIYVVGLAIGIYGIEDRKPVASIPAHLAEEVVGEKIINDLSQVNLACTAQLVVDCRRSLLVVRNDNGNSTVCRHSRCPAGCEPRE